ncbi:DUF4132 domain-containing protein [Actinomadura algeriensis]|uniref:DUF4132 domain-containing protein n=1 Tax=Actinomadura algeriensis TaxID=1679523 RepID=A0ABR9K4G7_9ACTN|nr:DUF4132 domain-containing protein [Actinomadura algeriensis]MBE1537270.1 hypothetical protein [Actinomadura algeriensis]
MNDENAFVMPDEWRRARHPRRDRPDVPEPERLRPSDADRARTLVDAARGGIEEILALPGTDPELAEAARAHLRGEANPLGAAVAAAITVPWHRLENRGAAVGFVTAWIADHGLPFAAAAYAELAGVVTDGESVHIPADRDAGTPSRRVWTWTAARRRGPDERRGDTWWLSQGPARFLRAGLAAAPADVYAEAVEGLAARRGGRLQRLIAAYLAPTEDAWVEELCADPGWFVTDGPARWAAFCALGRPHQPAALGLPLASSARQIGVVASLVDGIGPEAVVPLVRDVVDAESGTTLRRFLDVLGEIPLDEAFRVLAARAARPAVTPVLLAAARRFPVRALRLLPEARPRRAADLLALHVRAHRDLAEETLDDLPAGSRAAVRAVLDANPPLPDAPDLPPLLTDPPWTRPRTRAAPVVIENLPFPGLRTIEWAPGERAEWAAREPGHWARQAERTDFTDAAERFATGDCGRDLEGLFLVRGPGELVLPLLDGWTPPRPRRAHDWLPPLVARFGPAVHDTALAAARRDPSGLARYLLPLLSDEVARAMAHRLPRKRGRETARAWFDRHGTAAAPALLPDALGEPGAARRAAEHALRHIADRHGRAPVAEAARVHGDRAAAAIDALLGIDPLDDLPEEMPSVEWVDIRALPRPLLRDRTHALPDDAVRHVLTMLALSRPDEVYPGVRTVLDVCDRASLAEFGRALFCWWEACAAPADANWALTQLALTGDDETVRALAPVIRAWPGESGHAKAVTGLDVLAAIGTGTALTHLHSISRRVKFKGLKARAQEKIEEVAADLGLTSDQLADRLIPDFGLDVSGTLTLDYGPRRFVIGFDERLEPTITDDDGGPRKSLPKPSAKDDADLAAAARKRFTALKKDVRAVASDQLARLEQAMVTGHRRPASDFREFLVAHPLVGLIVRRLVWLADGDGPAFRVAEDGTFADIDDGTVTLPAAAHVRVAHPLHLGDDLPAWSEVFADYEILQPFEQLGRAVHTLTPDEEASEHLARFEGAKVPSGAVLGLVHRGWERGVPQDAGFEWWISRRLAPGRFVVIDLDPGITVGAPEPLGEQQTLGGVRLAEFPGRRGGPGAEALRLGDLDPVLVSEVIADLTRLTATAPQTQGTSR